MENNKQLIEEKNNLKKEKINIELALKNNKKNIELIKSQNLNGDGVLSRDEIIEGYRKTYGAVDENEIDNIMKSIDWVFWCWLMVLFV